mgnify:CR=1 FL=1
MEKNAALGRGLSDLMSEASSLSQLNMHNKESVASIPLNKIVFNPKQPRTSIITEELEELAASIRELGVIQPILLRSLEDGFYQIIAGERRFHATKKAGLTEIPAIIKDCNELDVLEIAIVENIQRKDLTPMEEAVAYKKLLNDHSHTQETLAKRLGKSRSYVSNIIRLNNLPEAVRKMLENGKISVGHAKAILASDDQMDLARVVVENNLNVRETEKLIKKLTQSSKDQDNGAKQWDRGNIASSSNNLRNDEISSIEKELMNMLQVKVRIRAHRKGYDMKISCDSIGKLDLILAKLSTKAIL